MNGKKFTLNLILNIIIKIGAVGVGVLASRWANVYLSATEYESYITIIAYTTVILAVTHLGLPVIIQKYYTNVADNVKRSQLWTAMLIMRVVSFLIGILIIMLTYQFSRSENMAIIIGFFSIQFILVFDGHYRSVCDAEGRSWQFSVTDFVAKLLSVSFLYVGVLSLNVQPNLWFLMGCLGVSYVVAFVTDVIWQYPDTKLSKPDFTEIKLQIVPMLLLTLANITYAAYNTTDKLFIANLNLPKGDLAGYSNGYKVYESALIIPGVAIPMLASYMKKRYDRLLLGAVANRLVSKYRFSKKVAFFIEWTCVSGSIGLLITIGVLLFGPILLSIIDPNNFYPKSYTVLPILAVAAFINPIVVTLAQFIIFMKNGEKYELAASVILMIVALVGYWVLIPQFGIIGASLATLIALVFDVFLKIYFLSKVVKNSSYEN